MAVPLTLRVFKGEALVTTRDYDRDIIKIGRLASAHLCLDDDKVSRIHSVIEVAPDGKLSIIDMGSVEGTFVNGKRVNKGAIAFGDEIRVGNTLIKVDSATEQAAANLASAASLMKEESTKVTRVTPSETVPAPHVDPAVALAQTAQVAATQSMQLPSPAAVAAPPAPSAPQRATRSTPAPVATSGGTPSRTRPSRKKGSGPLGLELRFMWGDQRVGEFLLSPGTKTPFSVGSAPGVQFTMGDSKLGVPKFDVISADGESFQLRFTGKMVGELQRAGTSYDLKRVIESGKASHDGDSYALPLETDDFAWLDLGNITLLVSFQPIPKAAFLPWMETVDFTSLFSFLLMLGLGGLFVISALNRDAEGDGFSDELNSANQAMTKLLIKPPEDKQNRFLQQLAQDKSKRPEAPSAHSGTEGQMGKQSSKEKNNRAAPKAIDKNSKDIARLMVSKIFGKGGGGVTTLFGRAGLGGELNAAMGNMMGKSVGDAFGTGGLGLKGGGGGGGGTGNTIGIGAVGTRGIAGAGDGKYGSGSMGHKSSIDPNITSSAPEVMGSLDPELIRRVIRSHVDQVRYCYELQLPRNPRLTGKVAVKFIITGSGTVATSGVAQSTVGNSELESCIAGRVKTWVFPKPKGGGTVVVTYPFVLKQAGE